MKGLKKRMAKKKYSSQNGILAPSLLIAVFVLFLFFISLSCSQYQNPLAPDEQFEQSSEIKGTTQNVIPRLLMWKSNSLAKSATESTESKLIEASKGGVVGGKKTLNTRVIIPPGALRENTVITISFPNTSILLVDFNPSYEFEKPVQIEICYSYADLEGVSIENLASWYIDQGDGYYKIINSRVDKKRKIVIAEVNHFSRYGLSDD